MTIYAFTAHEYIDENQPLEYIATEFTYECDDEMTDEIELIAKAYRTLAATGMTYLIEESEVIDDRHYTAEQILDISMHAREEVKDYYHTLWPYGWRCHPYLLIDLLL